MVSYYNEIDPYAAQWLRNLIANKLIADGDVDERSICDVAAADLHGYTQCHFFAGIGVWSHALRLAGWPDDRPVWTGSCPCQPFSAAGKGKGFDDERHLWPVFHRLIRECQPTVVFGEQVASKDGLAWLDTVHADLQASGYACGAVDWCAAGVGAPHIRQRLWFVGERLADTQNGDGRSGERGAQAGTGEDGIGRRRSAGCGTDGGLGHHHHQGLEGQRSGHQAEAGWLGAVRPVAEAGEPRGMADADGFGRSTRACGDVERQSGVGSQSGSGQGQDARRDGDQSGGREANWTAARQHPSADHGGWSSADWLHCRDGRWRPVEPGTFPLVNGAPARVGRLRAYGNAIVPQVAAEVIGAYLDARP